MKTFIAVAVALTLQASIALAGTAFPGTQGGGKSYKLNNTVGKNHVTFTSDAPAEKIHGTSDGIAGQFVLDAANLEATTGSITVQVRSMKTAVSKRDEHMYSEMWLDADKYGAIVYNVTSLKDVKVTMKDGRNIATATAIGTFTLHGVTKPLNSQVTITYLPESADTKKRAPGNLVLINAKFEVKLSDYNVTGKAGVIGKSVGESIAIDASLFANS